MDFWDIAGDYMQGWRFKATRVGQPQNFEGILKKVESGEVKVIGSISPKGALSLRTPKSLEPEEYQEEDILIIFEKEPAPKPKEARPDT